MWKSDFDKSGLDNFFHYANEGPPFWGHDKLFQGGIGKLIPDPTGSGRGIVFYAHHEGTTPQDREGGQRNRVHPGIWFPFKAGPYSVSVDLYLYDDMKPLPPTKLADDQPWFSPFGPFDKTVTQGDSEYHVAYVVHLMRDNKGSLFLTLRAFDKDMKSMGAPNVVYPNAPPFVFEKWTTIRVDVLQDRRIILFQDGLPVCETRLPETTRLGTVGGHAGLYTGPTDNITILNDNFSIVVYPSSSQ